MKRIYDRVMDGGEAYAVERLDGDTWVPVCAGSGPHGQERVERLVERERKRDPGGRYRASIARVTHAWEPK